MCQAVLGTQYTVCYAQSPSPQNWENKMSTAMQKHKGVLLPARTRAPISSSAVESWQEPGAQIYSSIYKFRKKTGSWQGLIGCRGFLVLTDWPVIIFLTGQSYHLSDWPELPSPEAPEAWLRDYFWPSVPLWACHGSGEVVIFPPVFRSYRGIFLFVLGYSLMLLSKHK